MIGGHLARYASKTQQWAVFDFESAGVNLAFSLPWEVSWGVGTLDSGLTKVTTRMLRWPDFTISPHLALKTHFDERRYKAEAQDPRQVWEEFAPVLYGDGYRPAGHNVIGFDSHMISVWRRRIGLPPDHSWMGGLDGRRCVVDTDCIARGHFKKWTPDTSSPEAFLRWQYQAGDWIEKGLKSNLGLCCETFGIEYDKVAAHAAEYDIGRNMLVLSAMAKVIEF